MFSFSFFLISNSFTDFKSNKLIAVRYFSSQVPFSNRQFDLGRHSIFLNVIKQNKILNNNRINYSHTVYFFFKLTKEPLSTIYFQNYFKNFDFGTVNRKLFFSLKNNSNFLKKKGKINRSHKNVIDQYSLFDNPYFFSNIKINKRAFFQNKFNYIFNYANVYFSNLLICSFFSKNKILSLDNFSSVKLGHFFINQIKESDFFFSNGFFFLDQDFFWHKEFVNCFEDFFLYRKKNIYSRFKDTPFFYSTTHFKEKRSITLNRFKFLFRQGAYNRLKKYSTYYHDAFFNFDFKNPSFYIIKKNPIIIDKIYNLNTHNRLISPFPYKLKKLFNIIRRKIRNRNRLRYGLIFRLKKKHKRTIFDIYTKYRYKKGYDKDINLYMAQTNVFGFYNNINYNFLKNQRNFFTKRNKNFSLFSKGLLINKYIQKEFFAKMKKQIQIFKNTLYPQKLVFNKINRKKSFFDKKKKDLSIEKFLYKMKDKTNTFNFFKKGNLVLYKSSNNNFNNYFNYKFGLSLFYINLKLSLYKKMEKIVKNRKGIKSKFYSFFLKKRNKKHFHLKSKINRNFYYLNFFNYFYFKMLKNVQRNIFRIKTKKKIYSYKIKYKLRNDLKKIRLIFNKKRSKKELHVIGFWKKKYIYRKLKSKSAEGKVFFYNYGFYNMLKKRRRTLAMNRFNVKQYISDLKIKIKYALKTSKVKKRYKYKRYLGRKLIKNLRRKYYYNNTKRFFKKNFKKLKNQLKNRKKTLINKKMSFYKYKENFLFKKKEVPIFIPTYLSKKQQEDYLKYVLEKKNRTEQQHLQKKKHIPIKLNIPINIKPKSRYNFNYSLDKIKKDRK